LREDWNVHLINWEDSAHTSQEKGLTHDKCLGLAHLSRVLLGLKLPEKENWSVRCSVWDKPLNDTQIQYAAMDVVAGLVLSCLVLTCHYQARKYSNSGKKRLEDRQEKTPRLARKDSKAG
jgi:hypothetical protein